MTNLQSAVEAQQRAINLLSGMGGYDGTVAALIGPEALQALLLAQPKVWLESEISDAPDEEYKYWESEKGWSRSSYEKQRVKLFPKLYGPIPQPPESELA